MDKAGRQNGYHSQSICPFPSSYSSPSKMDRQVDATTKLSKFCNFWTQQISLLFDDFRYSHIPLLLDNILKLKKSNITSLACTSTAAFICINTALM